MKQVTFTRDMRPYQGGHDYALPDAVADKLIAEGGATATPIPADGITLRPDDAQQDRPRNRYLTRKG
jgi:hypothetical protein